MSSVIKREAVLNMPMRKRVAASLLMALVLAISLLQSPPAHAGAWEAGTAVVTVERTGPDSWNISAVAEDYILSSGAALDYGTFQLSVTRVAPTTTGGCWDLIARGGGTYESPNRQLTLFEVTAVSTQGIINSGPWLFTVVGRWTGGGQTGAFAIHFPYVAAVGSHSCDSADLGSAAQGRYVIGGGTPDDAIQRAVEEFNDAVDFIFDLVVGVPPGMPTLVFPPSGYTYQDTETQVVSVRATDPNVPSAGYFGEVEIRRLSGSVVATFRTLPASSGQNSTGLVAHQEVFLPAGNYEWRARARNGRNPDSSAWSAWQPFSVSN